MLETCEYEWSVISDEEAEDEVTDLLSPPKNFITFEIYHSEERSHEIKSILDTTIPLTNEEFSDAIKEYSDFYGVPIPPDIDNIINNFTFIQRRI